MTPEKAQYYWMMLRLGQQDAYERELDRLLEEEDPLSPLTLDLAVCMSDVNQTLSVLRDFVWDHPVDQLQVYDMILDDLRQQYTAGALSAEQTAGLLWNITRLVDDSADPPWVELHTLIYDYELWDEGMISKEVFHQAFDSVFLHGKRLDAWALQREQNKKKSWLDFFRKPK